MGLTLEDCLAIARRHQPSLQVQREVTHIARENVDVAKSFYFPQVDAEARFTTIDQVRSFDIDGIFEGEFANVFSDAAAFFEIARQANSTVALNALDNPDTPLFPSGPTFNSIKQAAADNAPNTIRVPVLGEAFLNTQIQLVQPIWVGGRIKYRVQQAKYGVRFASQSERRVRQLLEFNVTRAYLSVLLSRHLRDLAERSVAKTKFIERTTKARIERDPFRTSTFELHRVQSYRGLFEEQVVRFRVAEKRAKAALLLAMGMPQSGELDIANEELGFDEVVVSSEESIAVAVGSRPEVTQAVIGSRVADLDYRLAIAEFLPEIAAFGRFASIHDDRNFANPNDDVEWAGGVVATIQLTNGGRRRAEKRIATHRKSKAIATINQVKLLVEQEVRDATLELEQAQANATITQASHESAVEALDVLDAEVGITAKSETKEHAEDRALTILLFATSGAKYYQSLFTYNLAIARLKLAVGDDRHFDESASVARIE